MRNLIRLAIIATLITLSLSGCTGPVAPGSDVIPSPNIQQSTPSAKPVLSIDSTGWECSSHLDTQNPYGSCIVSVYEGATDPPVDARSIPYAVFEIMCQTKNSPSSAFFFAGPNLKAGERYSWNPTKYPTLRYSIDQGPKQESTYDITAINGQVYTDSYDVDANKTFIRNLSGADTLQVWVQDYKGIEHQLDFLVTGTVESVETLDAWGLNCKF